MSDTNGHTHFEDLAPQEIEFTVGKRTFILREADTSVYRRYRDGMEGSIKVDAATKRISGAATTGAQIHALTSSLTEIVISGDAKRMRRKVGAETVLAFKPAVTKWAWAKLCEISPGLSVEEDEKTRQKREDDLKNLPGAGTESSDTAEPTESSSTT